MVGSLEDALALARKFAAEGGVDEICVIGGGQIYVQAMPLADRLHLTRVSLSSKAIHIFLKSIRRTGNCFRARMCPPVTKTAIQHAICCTKGAFRKA